MVKVSDGHSLFDLDVYGSRLFTRHEQGPSPGNGDSERARRHSTDADILYCVVLGDLTTTDSRREIYVPTGFGFSLTGTVATSSLRILGPVTAGGSALDASLGLEAGGGSFNPGTSSLRFSGGGNGSYAPGVSTYYDLTVRETSSSHLTVVGAVDLPGALSGESERQSEVRLGIIEC